MNHSYALPPHRSSTPSHHNPIESPLLLHADAPAVSHETSSAYCPRTFLGLIAHPFARTNLSASGILGLSPLTSIFPSRSRSQMSTLSSRQIPGTPRVLSPSPDPPEYHVSGGSNHAPIPEKDANGANGSALKSRIARQPNGVDTRDPDYRARSRSRDLDVSPRKRRISGLAPLSEDEHGDLNGGTSKQEKTDFLTVPNGGANGHLSPGSVVQNYWREFSRSPSPLGIIPIHREWRSFVRNS